MHLVGFIINKVVTMHVHMNVKDTNICIDPQHTGCKALFTLDVF